MSFGRHFDTGNVQAWRRRRCLLLILGMLSLLDGCTSDLRRADSIARSGGLVSATDTGAGFRHRLYRRAGSPGDTRLFVFLEGDGRPWVHHGTKVSEDPTPNRPLALELAAQTPGAVLYVGRPCYFSAREDPHCTPEIWTSARYSRSVVNGIAETVNREVVERGSRSVILVGFSGGGALAVLAARDIPATQAVVTLSGNLDIDAWTSFHQYSPLSQSLNPAAEERLAPRIRQLHLVGALDDNIPEALARAYFDQAPDAGIWRYPSFDHGCCWVDAWPSILSQLLSYIDGIRDAPPANSEPSTAPRPPMRMTMPEPDQGLR